MGTRPLYGQEMTMMMQSQKVASFPDYSFTRMPEAVEAGIIAEKHPCKRSRLKAWLCTNVLFISTICGVLFGFVIGFALRCLDLEPNSILLLSYPGELFMRALKLVILPLIVSSLVSGAASLDARVNGKIAIRTLAYFVATSLFNAALGIAVVSIVRPGESGGILRLGDGPTTKSTQMIDSMLDLGRNIIPDNIFQATMQQTYTAYSYKGDNDTRPTRTLDFRYGTNTLGISVFCLTFGTILGTLGARSKVVIDFFAVIFEVVMKLVTGLMWLTPVGIASVIAGKTASVADLGLLISQLGLFIVTVAAGVFFYQLVVMQLIYFFFLKKNPFKFYLALTQGTVTAFATASTAAALPVTFRCMDEKARIDPRVTRFVLPIGCNINMDGTALFIAVASVFLAQMNGISLSAGDIITVWLTSTAASFSSASVPSAALVLLLMVLSSINVPTHSASVLFAIDWMVDRIRTTNNMLGDCYAAAVVEHLSKDELRAKNVPICHDFCSEYNAEENAASNGTATF